MLRNMRDTCYMNAAAFLTSSEGDARLSDAFRTASPNLPPFITSTSMFARHAQLAAFVQQSKVRLT